MEPRAHHVLIGFFTLVTVGAALIFALWLSKSSADQEYHEYEVIFKEAVTGLSKGSSVQYSGINVGDVLKLSLDPKDPRKVRALIRVASDTPVKENTRAKLSLTGVTGTAVIQLNGGTPSSPLLIGKGGDIPTIEADRSPLASLLANGEDVVFNINHLITQANHLFSDDNIERVGKTLDNIAQATTSISDQRDQLNITLKHIGDASAEAVNLMRTTNQLMDEQGREVFGNVERITASLEESSDTIAAMLQTNQQALNNGMQGVSQLGPAISELRETLSVLRSFSRKLEEDPSGYLLRSESIKEFQP
ncbi:ABC-type transport system involved in resistance to organic solvents, periplasmic component USSDB6C [Pseudomonas marincola]|uniref:ABC transporter permease n=1 Tax=Pseudomonas marincola TaxID=437900 RepID=A0A653E2M4_9PSED|nr:MlaD family protein [Pseudomonas marincola]CAE6885274.1 ABC-type transport system involved in resistance to organic solvents, periplasmic component USSDB6C [Pseudomonas marincola]